MTMLPQTHALAIVVARDLLGPHARPEDVRRFGEALVPLLAEFDRAWRAAARGYVMTTTTLWHTWRTQLAVQLRQDAAQEAAIDAR